ncbi:MAG TPA: DHH family phosphoesterase [Gemmatimonadota bacterium]|nr:DHH family phosphoesterase [Gemmatimonadota bacterium]
MTDQTSISLVSPAPPERAAGLARIRDDLAAAHRVVLTTHMNADGDGAGSEVALASWLLRTGREPVIVNPTPYPELYDFLREGLDVPVLSPADGGSGRADAAEAVRDADVVVVLDTAEAPRLGQVMPLIESHRILTIDHHPPVTRSLGELSVRDAGAAATGELVYDLLVEAGDVPTEFEARALYAAIATDTGSFRFSNTTSRVHQIAADLVARGVDPETMSGRLYGGYTLSRLALLQRALTGLRVHDELPVAWIRLTAADMREAEADRDDIEGLVEYARRLKGIEVAALLRELPEGKTKVSLRTSSEVDVAAAARELGGGGHVKAAGAMIDASLDDAEARVLEVLAAALGAGGGPGTDGAGSDGAGSDGGA